MTKAKEKTEKTEQHLEIRLSLIKKDVVVDGDGKVVSDSHTQNTAFDITDQDLCAEINELLGAAITKEHIEDVAKDDKGEPILDAHKFVLDGKKPEKKTPAA